MHKDFKICHSDTAKGQAFEDIISLWINHNWVLLVSMLKD